MIRQVEVERRGGSEELTGSPGGYSGPLSRFATCRSHRCQPQSGNGPDGQGTYEPHQAIAARTGIATAENAITTGPSRGLEARVATASTNGTPFRA